MKRVFDILFALLLLVPFVLLFLPIWFLVRCKLGNPALFKQLRPGLHGELFELRKFRSMTDARDEAGTLLPDEERLTSFGKFLRSTSVDELPELIHILKGEMSFVGPRPLLPEYLELYNERQARRHEVRPGLTGWAQVNGRNSVSWSERLEMDVWYVENQSLWLDLKIVALTVFVVLKRDGVTASDHVTMGKFQGEE